MMKTTIKNLKSSNFIKFDYKKVFIYLFFILLNIISNNTIAQLFEKAYDDNIYYEEKNVSTLRDDNNIYILSNINSIIALKRTDNLGNIIWIKQYQFTSNVAAFDLEFVDDKYIAIVGSIYGANDDMLILQVNRSTGVIFNHNILTSFEFENAYGFNFDVVKFEDKKYLAIVGTNSWNKINNDGFKKSFVMLYDITNNTTNWIKYFNTGFDYGLLTSNEDFDAFNGVTIDNNANIYAIGNSNRPHVISTPNGSYNRNLILANVIKLDIYGNVIWNHQLEDNWTEYSINNGVKIIYNSQRDELDALINDGDHQFTLIKYDVNGNILMNRLFGNTSNQGWELNTDIDNIYVSGYNTLLDSIFIYKIEKTNYNFKSKLTFASDNNNYIKICTSGCIRALNTFQSGYRNYFYYPKVSQIYDCNINFVTNNTTNILLANESIYMINTNSNMDILCNGRIHEIFSYDNLELINFEYEITTNHLDNYNTIITEFDKSINEFDCTTSYEPSCSRLNRIHEINDEVNDEESNKNSMHSYETYDLQFNKIDESVNYNNISSYIKHLKEIGISGFIVIKEQNIKNTVVHKTIIE